MVTFNCQSCGNKQPLKTFKAYHDRTITCVKCNTSVVIPAAPRPLSDRQMLNTLIRWVNFCNQDKTESKTND